MYACFCSIDSDIETDSVHAGVFFAGAAANANVQVLLQEGGGGGTLGKAMSLHMACVLPTHSAHMIALDDQYDEMIYSGKRIEVVDGSSPVPTGPGIGYEVNESEIRRMARQTGLKIPRHIGVLKMPSGHTYYANSYCSPVSKLRHLYGLCFEIFTSVAAICRIKLPVSKKED